MLQKNEANPSAEMTREAAKYLLNQQTMVAQYNRQRASDFQNYVNAGQIRCASRAGIPRNKSLQNYALQHDSQRQSQLAADRGLTIPPGAFDKLTQSPQLKRPFSRSTASFLTG